MTETLLACRNVWKVFGASRRLDHAALEKLTPEAMHDKGMVAAVRDVNLEVKIGEIFVIMGLSGSGKSTLVRCLSRLVEPTAGHILFKGEDLLAASDKRMIEIRREHMGMVFQNFALLPHLTVLENVAFPLEIQGVSRAQRNVKAREIVDLVGLRGKERFYPRQLSGGQQQRVGIARSLAVEPELWFLDEPFSALDPLIRREMQDEFLRLQSTLKKTIVFITHDFDEALRLADRIAVMKDGVIEQAASPEEILVNPATPYVAKFTENVSRAKAIRVTRFMEPLASKPPAISVPERSSVWEAGKAFTGEIAWIGITNAEGKPIGRVSRKTILAEMLKG